MKAHLNITDIDRQEGRDHIISKVVRAEGISIALQSGNLHFCVTNPEKIGTLSLGDLLELSIKVIPSPVPVSDEKSDLDLEAERHRDLELDAEIKHEAARQLQQETDAKPPGDLLPTEQPSAPGA